MLSFIVPAHNEEKLLPATLLAIRQTCDELQLPFEIVVACDACSDATADVAAAAGVRVVQVDHRQISRTRNSGAAASTGEFLFFIDADTLVSPAYVSQGLAAMQRGVAGGGGRIRFDTDVPGFARTLVLVFDWICRIFKVSGGCCLFSRRDAFEAVGGFDDTLFAGEELKFSADLRRHGGFAPLSATVTTSGRKLRDYSPRELLGVLWGVLRKGPAALKSREGLDLWYRRR